MRRCFIAASGFAESESGASMKIIIAMILAFLICTTQVYGQMAVTDSMVVVIRVIETVEVPELIASEPEGGEAADEWPGVIMYEHDPDTNTEIVVYVVE